MQRSGTARGVNYDIKVEIADYWDGRADGFDEHPGHAIRDGAEAEAWRDLLARHLPPLDKPRVLELGCGTGVVTEQLLRHGAAVTAVDLSEKMLARARRKLAGYEATIVFGDAEDPLFAAHSFDAVICRHLMWTLPEPLLALTRWHRLLATGGRALLIEGRWGDGGAWPRLLRACAARLDPSPARRATIGDAGSPYHHLAPQLPLGVDGARAERIVNLAHSAGFARTEIDRLSALRRAQRSGLGLAGKLRSLAIDRYLVRADA